MPKLSTRLTVALLTFLLGTAVTLIWIIGHSHERGPRVVVPDDKWVSIFFEKAGFGSKSINELTAEADLPSLQTVLLPDNDLEVRVWVGFGLRGVDGLVIRRSGDQWSAIHLHGMAEHPPYPFYREALTVPKSGWETAWRKLTNAGILTLPDASAIQCEPGGPDGTSYVVETNVNKIYRTYKYHNPEYAKCDEAEQMIRIREVIADEFGLKEFNAKE